MAEHSRLSPEDDSSLLEAEADALRGRSEEVLPGPTPERVAEGWEQRRGDQTAEAEATSLSRGRSAAERLMTGGRLNLPREQGVEQQIEAEYLERDYRHLARAQLTEQLESMRRLGGVEGRRRLAAIVQRLFELDAPEALAESGEDSGDGHDVYSRTILADHLRSYLGTSQASLAAIHRIGELSKQTGHYEAYGLVEYRDGKFHLFDQHDPAEAERSTRRALEEISKLSGREALKLAPHVFVGMRKGAEFSVDAQDRVTVVREGGRVYRVMKGGSMGAFEEQAFRKIFGGMEAGQLKQHTQARVAEIMLGGSREQLDRRGFLVGDAVDLQRWVELWQRWPTAMKVFWEKCSGQGEPKFRLVQTGADGEPQEDGQRRFVFLDDVDASAFAEEHSLTDPGLYEVLPDGKTRPVRDQFGAR